MTKGKVNKSNLVGKNIIYGFGSKFLILLLGLIIPRIIIVSYGSELNGFLSTITQIFTYFALLEAGIGNSAVNAMYGPLEKNDRSATNKVIRQARSYYRKATVIYFVLVIIFAIGYPLAVDSQIDKNVMIAVILLQGIPHAISYFFCAVYEQLLMADGKRYVSENVSLILYVLTSASKIALVSAGFNIVWVQAAYMIIQLTKVIIIIRYCRRRYPWIRFDMRCEENLLQERKAFIVHEISSTIFSNTDVFVISVFCGFASASVYTIYNMIYTALHSLVNTANGGLGFVLGRNLDKPKKEFELIYDTYSILYSLVVFVVMTVAVVLSIPFVKLYTAGVEDINYTVSGLPILFGMIYVMSGARAIPARLITVSGHADKTKNRSLIEMIINIVASLVLVQLWNLYGVLVGTIIALLYRMNDLIVYANVHVLHRKPIREYMNLTVNLILFFVIVFIVSKMNLAIHSYGHFFVYACLIFACVAIIYLVSSIALNRNQYKFVLKFIKKD